MHVSLSTRWVRSKVQDCSATAPIGRVHWQRLACFSSIIGGKVGVVGEQQETWSGGIDVCVLHRAQGHCRWCGERHQRRSTICAVGCDMACYWSWRECHIDQMLFW